MLLNILVISVEQASSSLSVNNKEEPVNYEDDDLIDIDSLLNDDILMSTSP